MFLPSSTNRTAIFNALKDTTRIFHNRLKLIDGNNIYYLSDLKSCTVTQNATGDERLSMGSAVSAELTATFIARYEGNITNIDDLVNRTTTPINNYATYNYKGKKIVAQCGILYDEENFNYIDVGTFFIDEVSTNDDGVTITIKAYDLLGSEYANQKVNLNGYTSSEKTIETLLSYIVTTYFDSFLSTNTVYYQLQNTNSKSRELTDPELAILNGGLTVREVIAAVAGLIGCNAKINTQNQLWIGWFRTYNTSSDSVPAPNGYDIEITREVQYQRGLKKLQQSVFYLARCTSSNNGTGSSGESISYTSAGATAATGITFTNIVITDEDIKDIAGATGAIINHQWMAADRSYQPCEVSWRGNPCVEAGDTIRAIDTNNNYNIVYIAKQTLNLCGGFKSEITCPIGDAQITFGGGDYVTPQQLNIQVSLLEDELIRATNKINGAQGGYIKILDLDGDGNADTIFVTDKEITEANINHTTGAINTGLGDNQPTKVIRINDEGIAIVSGPNAGTDVSAYSVVITGSKVIATDIIAGNVSTDKLVVGSSTDVNTLTAYINSTKQTADSAYNTQTIPEFWSTGSSATTTHFCIPGQNSSSTVSTVNSSFRIRQGSTILVHMTTSSQGGTSTGQKYLRVCYNQYGHGSGYTGGSYPCTDVYKTDGTLYGSLPSTSFIATIDLPIYYNGKPLLKNSPDLWAANTDVAFTWEGSHWTMSYSIPTTQTEGQSILAKEAQENFITNYGVCITSQGTTAKTVSIPSVTSLSVGTTIAVLFKYGNTASAPTLNVSGTGAKLMKQSDGSSAFTNWGQGSVQYFMYSGTYWVETTSYTDAMKIVGYCMNTNTTFVDGGNIYARSIYAGSIATGTLTANEIKSGSITADRLSVGTGVRQELLTNGEMEDGVIGYSGIGCTISAITSSDPAYSLYASTSSTAAASVGCWVYLDNNQCYQLCARVAPYSVSSVGSNPQIGFIIDDTTYTLGSYANLTTSTISSGKYTVIQHQFRWRGSSGYYRIGVYWQQIYRSGGNVVNMNIDWISLVKMAYATPGSGSGNASGTPAVNRESWLKTAYQTSPWLIPNEDSQSNPYKLPTDYEKASSLTVDEGGNLTTLGYIDTPLAKIGNIQFKEGYSVFRACTSYQVSTDQYNLLQSYAAFITPTGGAYPSSFNSVDIAQEKMAHLKLAYQDGTQAGASISWSPELGAYYTAGGMRVVLSSSWISEVAYDISAAHNVYGDNIGRSSQEIKQDIEESDSVLDKIKEAKIYKYRYKGDVSETKSLPEKKYGFIIEKETPKELIIGDDKNQSVHLYSMASMNWKATQELIEKIEKLEAIVNDGKSAKETS